MNPSMLWLKPLQLTRFMQNKLKFIQNDLALAIILACAFRISAFALSTLIPISNEGGSLVSPLAPQSYSDFSFYLDSLSRYTNSWIIIFKDFSAFYIDPDWFTGDGIGSWGGPIIAQPLFPALIFIFNFFSNETYFPLALFYLLVSCVLVSFWLTWLSSHNLNRVWLFIFAVIPNPVWFTLVISPDLVFAALFSGFYFYYFKTAHTFRETVYWILFLFFMLLTRPEGYSVLLFVALHIGWISLRELHFKPVQIFSILFLLLFFGAFLYPYFIGEMRKAGDVLIYFGYAPQDYVLGIFPILPTWIDIPLSWVSLFCSKFLYFVGIRPSYGVTAIELVIIRGLAGIVLLPGIIYLAVVAPLKEKVLIGIYLIPIILGPSQDRYYLAIYPIIFLYGVQFYNLSWRRIQLLYSKES